MVEGGIGSVRQLPAAVLDAQENDGTFVGASVIGRGHRVDALSTCQILGGLQRIAQCLAELRGTRLGLGLCDCDGPVGKQIRVP